jgi:hypothetical protein
MFIKLISIWINDSGDKLKVWQTNEKGLSYEVEHRNGKKNHYFGSYDSLKKKLIHEKYEEVTNEFINEKFIEEALKSGQKVIVPLEKIELSAKAKKFLENPNKDDISAEERTKIEQEINKHKQEINKLNALINKHKKQHDILKSKIKKTKKDVTIQDSLKIIQLVEQYCSSFIKEMKKSNNFLFRGMNSLYSKKKSSHKNQVVYGKSLEDREPVDTSKVTQKLFDQVLSQAGFKAIRGNSIFCTSDYDHAEGFGDLHIIFPKNGYNFTYAVGKHDWVIESDIFYDFKNLDKLNNSDYSLEEELYDITDNIDDISYLFNKIIDDNTIRIYKTIVKKYPEIAKKLINSPSYKNVVSYIKILTTKPKINNKNYINEIKKIVTVKFPIYQNLKKEIKNIYQIINPVLKDPEIKNSLSFFSGKYLNTVYNRIDKDFNFLNSYLKNDKAINSIKDVPKEEINKFITKFKLKNTDISLALSKNYEIYINGEYIAIPIYYVMSLAEHFLKGDIIKEYKYRYNDNYFDDDDDEDF